MTDEGPGETGACGALHSGEACASEGEQRVGECLLVRTADGSPEIAGEDAHMMTLESAA